MEANPSGRVLYTGKIVSLQRHVSSGGYTEGLVTLKPISADELEYGDGTATAETRYMRLPFQNEYLCAELFEPGQPVEQRGEILCTVPDLISLVGSDGNVEECFCKLDEIQERLAFYLGLLSTLELIFGKSLFFMLQSYDL